jgi:hypothetical protein
MRPQPESSTQEVLAGLVARVTSHNSENAFCVFRVKVRGHRDVVTVVGHAAAIAAGMEGRQWSAVRVSRLLVGLMCGGVLLVTFKGGS